MGEDDVAVPLGAEAGPLAVEESRHLGQRLADVQRPPQFIQQPHRPLGPRRFRTDVERVVFALVANRAIAPSFKLAAADWVTNSVAVPCLARMDEGQAYRAMDLLLTADAHGKVSETVFSAAANLLKPIPTAAGLIR